MSNGNVVAPGPVVKVVITTSSNDIVSESSQPERMAGKITGSVTSRITCQGFDPRSMAASSIERSKLVMRDCTIVVTNTMQKVMCASVTVVKPRLPGQPIHSASMTKKSSDETPVMTSGMMSGAVTMPENSVRPRNLLKRASAMPAMVPRMVAMVAEIRAISRESRKAEPICWFENSDTYQRVEKPPHTVARREALKE